MNKTLIATALCALMAAPSLALASVDLVVNGSFEAKTQANGTWNVYQSLLGWSTLQGSGIEVRNNKEGTAFDGKNFVELDGHRGPGNTLMAQTIATLSGQLYDLRFFYSARPNFTNVASNGIMVAWNGVDLLPELKGAGTNQHNWLEVHHQVLGTGSDTLSFRATGLNDSYGGSIDKVSLTAAVPEPGTYALMVAGLLAMGLVSRRRKAD
jgi:PEP-CTERM motif